MLAIEHSLGARLPSGLVVDADNSLDVTTPALLESGYEVLSLALPGMSEAREGPRNDAGNHADGARLRIDTCAFGHRPASMSAPPDGIVTFTDAMSTLLSVEDLARALSTYFDMLRPGGTLVLAHADYDRIFATDPDTAVSNPVVAGDPDTPVVFLERRLWTGRPRSRIFTADYLRMNPNSGTVSGKEQRLATSMTVLSDILRKAGFDAVAWKSPEETGFRLPLAVATKPPVPVSFFAPRPLDLTVGPAVTPPKEAEHTKFQFYPEDLDCNPFEERPDEQKSGPKAGGTGTGPTRKQVSLVMLSGGVDSVYVLHRLLRESDDEVIAHHIHFVNREGRHKAEDMACKRIVAHLRKTVRPFHYTESTIDRRRFNAFGMDDMCTGFEVGIISNSFLMTRGYPVDRWTSGTCLEEELEYYGSTELERFEHVLNAAAASSYPNPAPRYFQLKIIPKRDQLDYMGKTLVDLCWTCRTPVWGDNGIPTECGTCKTCTLMGRIRAGEDTIAHKPVKLP